MVMQAVAVVPSVPVISLCQCGCGGVAPLAKNTNRKRGTIRGVTRARYIAGHAAAINGRKGTLGQWGVDVGEPGSHEQSKFELTDEQVSEALERFFAEGETITSLCGRIFGGHCLGRRVRLRHAD